jgi:hypothetical protein
MENNPDIAASSAALEEWNETFTDCTGTRTLPLHFSEIEKFAKYRNPLNHPVAMFRKSILLYSGGYPNFRTSQDYALWSVLLAKGYKLANLPDILHKQRAGNELMNRRGIAYFKQELKILQFQHGIKFISKFEYIRNIIIRFLVRVPPNFVKKFLYKHLK